VQLPQLAKICARGQSWSWDEVNFAVLYPDTGDSARKNNSSCVLRVEGAGGSALLLGDIEREAEMRLLGDGAVKPSDIVIVPHHGSRTSSTEALTKAAAPKYALISAGYDNRWGFPKPEVIGRWQAAGAQTLKTADSGAIEIKVTRQGVAPPREYRVERRAYWRD
jgi:competence protein ComEC